MSQSGDSGRRAGSSLARRAARGVHIDALAPPAVHPAPPLPRGLPGRAD
ncbi:hypothetical protein BH10PSE5_BH10PSE5_36640 [soil metagenome]